MAIACTVCGLWYQEHARDRLDICDPCFDANFSGHAREGPSAREALEVYVLSVQETPPLTPRQVAAMTRIHQRWEAEARRRLEED